MNDGLDTVMEAIHSQCSERERECCELWCLSPCQGEQRGAAVFESAPNQTQADGWLSHYCGYSVSICSRLLWESYNYSACGVTNFTLALSCPLCWHTQIFLHRDIVNIPVHCMHRYLYNTIYIYIILLILLILTSCSLFYCCINASW